MHHPLMSSACPSGRPGWEPTSRYPRSHLGTPHVRCRRVWRRGAMNDCRNSKAARQHRASTCQQGSHNRSPQRSPRSSRQRNSPSALQPLQRALQPPQHSPAEHPHSSAGRWEVDTADRWAFYSEPGQDGQWYEVQGMAAWFLWMRHLCSRQTCRSSQPLFCVWSEQVTKAESSNQRHPSKVPARERRNLCGVHHHRGPPQAAAAATGPGRGGA
jgi:hypothetical protein